MCGAGAACSLLTHRKTSECAARHTHTHTPLGCPRPPARCRHLPTSFACTHAACGAQRIQSVTQPHLRARCLRRAAVPFSLSGRSPQCSRNCREISRRFAGRAGVGDGVGWHSRVSSLTRRSYLFSLLSSIEPGQLVRIVFPTMSSWQNADEFVRPDHPHSQGRRMGTGTDTCSRATDALGLAGEGGSRQSTAGVCKSTSLERAG